MLNIGPAELGTILLKPHLRYAGGEQWREIRMATQARIVRRIDINGPHAARRSGKAGRNISKTLRGESPDILNLSHADEAPQATAHIYYGVGRLLTNATHGYKLLTRGDINVHHNSGELDSSSCAIVAQKGGRTTRRRVSPENSRQFGGRQSDKRIERNRATHHAVSLIGRKRIPSVGGIPASAMAAESAAKSGILGEYALRGLWPDGLPSCH